MSSNRKRAVGIAVLVALSVCRVYATDVEAGRDPSEPTPVERWTPESMAAIDGAVRPVAPEAIDTFEILRQHESGTEPPLSTLICLSFASGELESALHHGESEVPGISLVQLVHNLNCTRNKRDYAPGQHVLSHMIDPKHIGVAYMEVLSLIDRFENAGPEAGAYLSNLVHCPRLVMKRCGRGCYEYPEAVTIFDEIDDWLAKYPHETRLRTMLHEIDRHLAIHQKRFPVIFDPQACPGHLQKRVPTRE